jgi:hypothetical protein
MKHLKKLVQMNILISQNFPKSFFRRIVPRTTTSTTCHIINMCFGSNSSSNGDNATSLPSSMQGKPVAALVPPGQCQFTETLTAVPLLERFPVSETSCVIRFGLPDPNRPLNLSTCACILASAQTKGQDVTRPYTPISTNQDIGYFDLLVKNYGPEAHMSYHLCHDLQPGEMVKFKHIPFNVKIQAPFDQYDRIAMIVGGTGTIPPWFGPVDALQSEFSPNVFPFDFLFK